jgi:hypothetical protein
MANMLVFLDESGDTGWKQNTGSSANFVVSLVLFNSNDEAGACDRSIDKLRTKIKRPNFEFHFAHNSHKTRLEFLRTVAEFDFSVITIAIHKDPNSSMKDIYKTKNSFYRYACHTVMALAGPYLDHATIIMDKGNTDTFYGALRKSLRKLLDDKERAKIKKIKPQDSKKNNLLQLADYAAGIASRKVQGKKGWREYYAYISPKEIFYQELPKD